VISNRSNPASPTKGNFSTHMSATRVPKPARKLPKLSILMQRKVKVTQLVQQAVQFVGSDVMKVLQVSSHSPTVADVANTCLNFLNNENSIKEFYIIFSEASGKDPSTIGESSSIFFGVFALQALQSLRAQAISAYEFSHDFEMIYRTCYQDQNFQICMHELNPAMRPLTGITPSAFAPDTEARNICWKMARLLALKYDYKNKSDPEAKDHRRNHILLSATSIIIAANIGKSIKNGEVTTGSPSAQNGDIPDFVDFVALVAAPVSDLFNFLAKNMNQNQGMSPLGNADIRSHVFDTCILINKLGMGQRSTNNVVSSSVNPMLAKAFSPANHYVLIHDYRNIIQTLVTATQKELKINTAKTNQEKSSGASVRTGIVYVLLFFPMVIGEPWGIHRDAPMITSKMLCSGENSKPSDPLKHSVAVVLKMKPRPKVIKRKATATSSIIVESIRTDNKKAKIIVLSESPKKIPSKVSQEPIDLVGEVSTSPLFRAPIDVRVGEIEGPIVNDSSELNEWTLSILSLSVIKPTDTLLTYLGENDRMRSNGSSSLQDVIVPVLNRGVLRIQTSIRSSSNRGSGVMGTKLTVGRRDGQVYVNGVVDQNIQLCASVVGFYYYSLEAIIQDQMERMEFLGSFGSQLQSGFFHRALLACCYSCILKGVGRNQKLQMNKTYEIVTVQVLMETTESDSFTFLKVIEAFCRALLANKEFNQNQIGSPIIAGLPVILYKHVQKIEVQLIDSVLWNTTTTSENTPASFPLSIKTMKSLPGAWPPDILEPMLPEEIADIETESSKSIEVRYKPSFGSSSEANFLSFVLRKLLKCINFRIRAICAALDLSNESALHTQILVAFRYLLRYHISIFNDRHVDQLLLCTVFGICRIMKIRPRISFAKVIDAYFTVRGEDQGERACRIIVRHIKLASPGNVNGRASQVVANIVVFYNTVYVPNMKKYFLGSKSLKTNTELYQTKYKKEEISNGKRNSQKKNTAEKVSKIAPKFPVTAAAATQISQSINSQTIIAGAGSRNEKSMEKNTTEEFSVKRNGPTVNSITVILKNKSTSLNSAENLLGINGVSPIVEKPTSSSKPKPTSSPSVMENLTVNGLTSSGAKEVDKGSKEGKTLGGKSTFVVREASISAGAANGSEKSMSNFSNKPSASSCENSLSHADNKPTLFNTKETIDVLTDTNAKEVPMDVIPKTDVEKQTESALPNGAVLIEGTIDDDSHKKGSEITGSASSN